MSGSFLTPNNRSDAREREAERNLAEYHEEIAGSSYRWATGLLLAGMLVIALPELGIAEWNWYIVGGVALVMTILAIRMMIHGRIGNGLICLLCAFAVLPGWVYIAADVVAVVQSLYQMLAKQWKDKLG